MTETPETPDAGARDGILIPQKHGGALRPPFAKGSGISQGAARNGVSAKAVKKQVLRIFAEASPALAQAMVDSALAKDANESMRAAVAHAIHDRIIGKATEHSQLDDDIHGLMDVSHLSAEERLEVRALSTRLRELLRRPNAVEEGAGAVIDGSVSDDEA